jgi:general secretion pathway protein G
MDLNYYAPTIQHRPKGWSPALTLIELIITVAIIGVLSAIAVPVLTGYINDSRNAKAKADVANIESQIERYRALHNGVPPNNLAAASIVPPLDPWGRAYRYLRIQGVVPQPPGIRKDHSTVPLNADYDLYSIGADGLTDPALTGTPAWDDIIRANNGAFIDLGSEY